MNLKVFQDNVIPLKDGMFRLANRMLNNRVEAEDAVQDTLIKLWTKRAELDQVEKIGPWSLKVVRNHCLDCIKSKNRRSFDLNEVSKFKSDLPSPEEITESKDTFEMIQQIIEGLPEKQKTVMHLREIEELSYQEIAETMGISLENVKVCIFRARKSIRKVYKKVTSNER